MSAILERAKAIAAVLTAVAVAVQAQWIDAPSWFPALIAGLGAVAVYTVPNKQPE